MVVRRVVEIGSLRAGLTVDHAVDGLSILNDPAHYAALVIDRAWAEPDYRRWLGGQMCAALLDDPGDRAVSARPPSAG